MSADDVGADDAALRAAVEELSGRFGAHRPECPAAPASTEPEGGEGRG